MKKTTFILGFVFLLTVNFSLPGNKQYTGKETMAAKPKSLIDVYCATGNPTNDYIYVHLWNAGHNYYFSVPPQAPSGYIMGQIEAECGYSVSLSSSGGPHTLQFYWYYAGYVTNATYSGAGMCLTCTSCPSLRISN